MKNSALAVTALFAVAGLNMGNQGCTPPATTGPMARILKMDTSVGVVAAQKVTLPSGEIVDFPYVANALFYGEVMNSDHMTIASALPNVPPSGVSSQSVQVATSAADAGKIAVLRHYGLVNAEYVSELPVQNARGMTAQSLSALSGAPVDLKCTYETPEFSMGGAVTDFSASAGGGLDIGFGKSPAQMGNIGVTYSQTKLDLRLQLNRPLTQLPLEIGDAKSYQKSVSAQLGIGQIGLNFFFKSAISDAIKQAMDSALSDIIGKYTAARNPEWNKNWESRVVYCQQCDKDTHIAIRGGAQNGVKLNDSFSISNLNYQWEDESAPCRSRLVSSIPDDPSVPTATGITEYVDDNFSVLKITKYSGNSKIRVGARVQLDSFAPAAALAPATTPSAAAAKN